MKLKHILTIILKVITIAFASLGVIFSGMLIVNAIRGNIEKAEALENKIEPLELNLTNKGAINNSDLYLFTSSYDIHSIIGYLLEYYDIPNYNISDKFYAPRTDKPLGTNNVPFCTFDRYNANNWTASNFNYSISYFCLTLDSAYKITGSNNIQYQVFGMSLYACGYNTSTQQETRYWRYAIDYFPGYNSNNQRVYNSYSINYGASTSINGFFFIDKNTNADWYEAFTYDTHQNGYEYGYNVGFQDGEAYGYNQGLIAESSNPFNLLERAFGSIGSILNIQILPGLTLGITIFAPLVVLVIIVVVKMFKG